MAPFAMSALATALSSLAVAGIVALMRMLRGFIAEQRSVNAANADANRSTQREAIYRMFRDHVERGEPMAPHELDHLEDVYRAYTANGGNGTATTMYERVKEHARIATEVRG